MDKALGFEPQWPAPECIGAFITTRRGGFSEGAYGSNNLADHVDDKPEAVEKNRQQLVQELGLVCQPQWLSQVHGTDVVEARSDNWLRTADACYTFDQGLACAVLTADCLPVLICDKKGTQVAAVHAGWRGLAGGILSAALDKFNASPDELLVYLGPAIGQPFFDVGVEVLEAFFESAKTEDHATHITQAFKPHARRPLHFQADLYALARAELNAHGVTDIFGGDQCTFAQRDDFYSYRRDGDTGRMASLIWIKPST